MSDKILVTALSPSDVGSEGGGGRQEYSENDRQFYSRLANT